MSSSAEAIDPTRPTHRSQAEKRLVRLRRVEISLLEMARNQKPPCDTQARAFVCRPCGSHVLRSLRLFAAPSSAGNARDRRYRERRKPKALTEQFCIHTSCYLRRSLKPQFLSVNSVDPDFRRSTTPCNVSSFTSLPPPFLDEI